MKNSPSVYDLFRAQRLIRLGEWLEAHESMIELICDTINLKCSEWAEDEDDHSFWMGEVCTAASAFREVMCDLKGYRNDKLPVYKVFENEPVVTTYHPLACDEHKHSTIVQLAKQEDSIEAE